MRPAPIGIWSLPCGTNVLCLGGPLLAPVRPHRTPHRGGSACRFYEGHVGVLAMSSSIYHGSDQYLNVVSYSICGQGPVSRHAGP
ncbi:hypothetical protein BJV82DRAFT_601450, partial [Fennellomyces sp. T-0311]